MLSWCCQYECYINDGWAICKSCGAKKLMAIENVKCPDCGGEMKSRTSKYGVFWGCVTYPKCRGTRDTEGKSKAERDAERNVTDEESENTNAPSMDRAENDKFRFRKM